MASAQFDVIVIGAGINGTAAAYTLAKRGRQVLLLDQYGARNRKGGSHGQSRCFRVTYRQPLIAKLSQDSSKIWEDLEVEVGERLLIKNGMLTIFESVVDAEECRSLLESLNCAYSLFNSDQVNLRWPNLHLPADFVGLFEEGAGTLLADKCLAALQNLFQKYGGIISECEKVLQIIPGEIVNIETQTRSLSADAVIITAGAWSPELTKLIGVSLPVKIVGVHAHYFRVSDPLSFDISCFPVISYKEPCEVYGMAACERPGMIKFGNNFGVTVIPDKRDDEPDLSNLLEFFNRFLSGVEGTPAITEPCLYDCTPDRDFIIDQLSEHKNIVVGAFSGHGFKMAPVNGEILADLALGKKPRYDITSLRLSRFLPSEKHQE